MQDTARVKGVQLHVLKASIAAEIDTAFATLSSQLRAAALIVQSDPFFVGRRNLRYWPPAISFQRSMTCGPSLKRAALISYGRSLPTVYHRVGAYAGTVPKCASNIG